MPRLPVKTLWTLRCALATTVLVLGLLAAAGTSGAAETHPGKLWSDYPLHAGPGSGAAGHGAQLPPARGHVARRGSGGAPSAPLFAALAAALAGLAAGMWLSARRRGAAARLGTPRIAPARTGSAPVESSPDGPGPEPEPGARVLAYVSFHAGDERLDVPSVAEQETLIRECCAGAGWRLVGVLCDPGTSDGRPALEEALSRLAAGEARSLVVTQVDRLGASAAESGAALERVRERGAALVSLDDSIDRSLQPGGVVTDLLQTVAGRQQVYWELRHQNARARPGRRARERGGKAA